VAGKTIENAGGNAKIIEASANLTMREPGEDEPCPEHDDEHEPMTTRRISCAHGLKQTRPGPKKSTKAKMHEARRNCDEHEYEDETRTEHTNGREILTLTLASLEDGSFGGYLEFDAEIEDGYAFTTSDWAISA
jgi:hypothetical protein